MYKKIKQVFFATRSDPITEYWVSTDTEYTSNACIFLLFRAQFKYISY